MLIKTSIEMSDLSIEQMRVYAAKNHLLFCPSQYSSVQTAWDYLVFASKATNEIDLYVAVSETLLPEVMS